MHLDINLLNRAFNDILLPFDMDVYQYFPGGFYHVDKVKEVDFQLDIIDISYYTARTLCSSHLTNRELYFDVIASLMSHLNFLDVTQANLLLGESRYKRLRDFSKSSRVGEMAQGINAFFVGKRLNFPYIIDFDLAKNKTHTSLNIQSNGKAPDFVVLDATLSKIGLFESKGNMNRNPRADLISAMNQINDVFSPCFDSKIPVSTKFQNNNDYNNVRLRKLRKSSINYGLIEEESIASKETELLLKLHYASWFYLVGDFDRVESILNDGVVSLIQEEGDSKYFLDTETDKGNPIYWVNEPLNLSFFSQEFRVKLHLFITSRYFHWGEFKIGIYKKIIDKISKNEPYFFEVPEGDIDYLKKFPDGTLLFIKSNE